MLFKRNVQFADQYVFSKGQACFNQRQFWEAHEFWEDLWKVSEGADKRFIQGFIHLTAGYYHWTQNNWAGARSQWNKAYQKLNNFPAYAYGLSSSDFQTFLKDIVHFEHKPQTLPFVSFSKWGGCCKFKQYSQKTYNDI